MSKANITRQPKRTTVSVSPEKRYAACVLRLFHHMPATDVGEVMGLSPETIRKYVRALTPEQRQSIESDGSEYIATLKESLKVQLTMQLERLHRKTIEGAQLLADKITVALIEDKFTPGELVVLAKNLPIGVGVYVDKFLLTGGWSDKMGGQPTTVAVNVQFGGQDVVTPERVPQLQTVAAKELPAPEEPPCAGKS